MFPKADPTQAEVDTDGHFLLDNDSSFKVHPSGADAILEKEKAAGWLEWSPNRRALEDKYGPITQNRIEVTVKTKNGNQKLRLILT